MTVAELISYLQTQPQDLQVAYRLHSEQCLIELGDITVAEKCVARSDGWIHDKRSGVPLQKYLLLPGN